MTIVLLLILVSVIFFIVSLLKYRDCKQAGHKSSWIIVSVVTGAVVIIFLGMIFYVGDYYSAKHWIEIIPIADTSSQNRGVVDFSLPKGEYIIVVFQERNSKEKDSVIIRYSLEVPEEGIKISQEKNLAFAWQNSYHLDKFTLSENQSEGQFSVEVIKPSKSKISVKLVTNRYL